MAKAYPLLEEIKLKRMVVSDEGLEMIGGVFGVLRNMRELDLPESEGEDLMSLSALQRLVARSPNLKTRAVQLEKFSTLLLRAPHHMLTFLNSSYATIESPDVSKIISQCPNLQRLWNQGLDRDAKTTLFNPEPAAETSISYECLVEEESVVEVPVLKSIAMKKEYQDLHSMSCARKCNGQCLHSRSQSANII
uniref:Uncharacterized protein n=1 Tax=Tanacetum cinerariifolium TaxID=118510 RepID=A0A699HRW0_TANCI|nr:hypothetical protein [Tanacetum cinerariifolium]